MSAGKTWNPLCCEEVAHEALGLLANDAKWLGSQSGIVCRVERTRNPVPCPSENRGHGLIVSYHWRKLLEALDTDGGKLV